MTREGFEQNDEVTIEGLDAGRRRGHYLLWNAKVISGEDASHSLDGVAEIPERRVIFIQVLG